MMASRWTMKKSGLFKTSPRVNFRQVSRFLGICAWYSKFIKHFFEICEPLFQLKWKRIKIYMDGRRSKSFWNIRIGITSPPVLAHPNHTLLFELATDTSSCGLGAVLVQNSWLIAFTSRTLNLAERNYPIIIFPVTAITDHSALTKLTYGKGLSSRIIKWALKLADYNIVIEQERRM